MNKKSILFLIPIFLLAGCNKSEKCIKIIHIPAPTPYDDVLYRDETDGFENVSIRLRTSGELAIAVFTAYYGKKGIHVNVNVEDSIVCTGNTACFYDDNIEYVIQSKTNASGWDVDKTIHIMVTAAGFTYVQKAETYNSWSTNYDKELNVNVGEDFIYEVNRFSGEKEGYSVSTYVSYKLLNTTREEAVGNITLCPAFRNTKSVNSTIFGVYTYQGCVYESSKTHLRLTKNNCFVGGNE